MDELLSKEELSQLIDEVKKLENSVLLRVIKSKRDNAKEACATMPVYDNESIANREFTRGYMVGLEWILKDVYDFIDKTDKLLQKKSE
jgi:hypothetical protein